MLTVIKYIQKNAGWQTRGVSIGHKIIKIGVCTGQSIATATSFTVREYKAKRGPY